MGGWAAAVSLDVSAHTALAAEHPTARAEDGAAFIIDALGRLGFFGVLSSACMPFLKALMPWPRRLP